MGLRKSKISKIHLCLFTMFLIVSTTLLPCRSFAGDMEILLNKLVGKGVLTKTEAENMLKEMQEPKGMEKGKMEGEQTKVPEWAKNLPDWVVNPPDWIKNIKLSGDFRLRYDYLDREPPESSAAQDISRNRGRFRYRLGVESKILDDVKVGFGLASGSGNPRSTNQTFDSEFTKKAVTIDNAFAEYTPLKWLSISAGKLKTNPIFRDSSLGFPTSGLLWDPDITPEGFTAVLNYPALLKLDAIDLDVFMNNAFFILDEFSNGREPYMFVFQPGFNLKIMKDINFKAAAAYYDFFGIKNKPPLGNQPSPGNTNTLFTSGPLAGNYQFDYDVFAASGEVGFKTPFQNIIPYVGLFGEYVYNPDPDHENKGYTGGIRVGYPSLAKLGDWQLAYAYRRLEKDAWLDIFPDDDFYQGQTNAKGHYLTGFFGITKNISTGVSYYHTQNIIGEKQAEDRFFADIQLKF